MKTGAKENVSNSNNRKPRTKFGNAIAKRKSNRHANSVTESAANTITDDVERINQQIGSDTFDADNGIVTDYGTSKQSGGRSGRNERNGSDGNGIDGRSDGDTSDNSARTGNKRRGRRSRAEIVEELRSSLDVSLEEAEKIYEQQRAPKKVKRGELVPDGVEGSVLLLSTVLSGGAELIAMASNKDYLSLQKAEANELSQAVLDLMNTWPSAARKRFDKLMKVYVPYWNLAKVITAITYPRYQIYMMEKELKNVATNQTQKQTSSNGVKPVNQAETSNADSTNGNADNGQNGFDGFVTEL